MGHHALLEQVALAEMSRDVVDELVQQNRLAAVHAKLASLGVICIDTGRAEGQRGGARLREEGIVRRAGQEGAQIILAAQVAQGGYGEPGAEIGAGADRRIAVAVQQRVERELVRHGAEPLLQEVRLGPELAHAAHAAEGGLVAGDVRIVEQAEREIFLGRDLAGAETQSRDLGDDGLQRLAVLLGDRLQHDGQREHLLGLRHVQHVGGSGNRRRCGCHRLLLDSGRNTHLVLVPRPRQLAGERVSRRNVNTPLRENV